MFGKGAEAGMGPGKTCVDLFCAIDAPEDRNGALKVSLNKRSIMETDGI